MWHFDNSPTFILCEYLITCHNDSFFTLYIWLPLCIPRTGGDPKEVSNLYIECEATAAVTRSVCRLLSQRCKNHAVKDVWESGSVDPRILTAVLVAFDWSSSRLDRFTSMDVSDTHCIGMCVGLIKREHNNSGIDRFSRYLVKPFALQACTGPWGSQRLSLQNF